MLTDSSNHVTGTLWRKSFGGTLTLIATSGGTGYSANNWTLDTSFTHTFNFDSYYYYVSLDISRGNSAYTMTFRGASIGS